MYVKPNVNNQLRFIAVFLKSLGTLSVPTSRCDTEEENEAAYLWQTNRGDLVVNSIWSGFVDCSVAHVLPVSLSTGQVVTLGSEDKPLTSRFCEVRRL